ncbi:MAG: hypothetical protein NTX64_19105 [Elusimicrobia bacterium]|nr:hypothetical protein [Elusimicrobiota bacterium]
MHCLAERMEVGMGDSDRRRGRVLGPRRRWAAAAQAAILSLLWAQAAVASPVEDPITSFQELERRPEVVARRAVMKGLSPTALIQVPVMSPGGRGPQIGQWEISGPGIDSAMDQLTFYTEIAPVRVMGYGPRLAGVFVMGPLGDIVAVLRRKTTGGVELVSGYPGFVAPPESEVLAEWRRYEAMLVDAMTTLVISTPEELEAYTQSYRAIRSGARVETAGAIQAAYASGVLQRLLGEPQGASAALPVVRRLDESVLARALGSAHSTAAALAGPAAR